MAGKHSAAQCAYQATDKQGAPRADVIGQHARRKAAKGRRAQWGTWTSPAPPKAPFNNCLDGHVGRSCGDYDAESRQ